MSGASCSGSRENQTAGWDEIEFLTIEFPPRSPPKPCPKDPRVKNGLIGSSDCEHRQITPTTIMRIRRPPIALFSRKKRGETRVIGPRMLLTVKSSNNSGRACASSSETCASAARNAYRWPLRAIREGLPVKLRACRLAQCFSWRNRRQIRSFGPQ